MMDHAALDGLSRVEADPIHRHGAAIEAERAARAHIGRTGIIRRHHQPIDAVLPPKACSRRWAVYADAGVFDESLVADLPQFAEDPKPAASECSDAESFALDEVFENEGAVEYAELLCTEEYDEGPDAPPPPVEAAYSVKFQPRFWRAVDTTGIKYRTG